MRTAETVLVTGGAGQIATALIPLLCNGLVLGPATRLSVHLLDIEPAKSALEGVAMEIQDCAYDLVDNVVATTSVAEAFKGATVAILLGGFPRKEGMERRDLIEKNVGIMRLHGEALERYADKNVKVLVVANPANTNCLTAMRYAPSIPAHNFTCLTRLDHDRLRGMLAAKIAEDGTGRVSSQAVRNVVIWGNHSSTQVPDVSNAEVFVNDAWRSVPSLVTDSAWLEEELVPAVQTRGAAVIAKRKASSALSAANAVAAHLRDWLCGMKNGAGFVSMGVLTDGKHHGIPEGLVFSMPVTCSAGGTWDVVDATDSGVLLGPPGGVGAGARAALAATIEELRLERKLADEIIGAHAAL